MRYHFFLHYGWFFQNLGKEAVRTFMHTTVCSIFLAQFVFYCADRLMMVNAGIGALFRTMPLHISEWFNQLVEP